ncbi:MAG: response regulator [Eubacteriales bacterium]|nr:response regulator [Eubacteriales bacterium]
MAEKQHSTAAKTILVVDDVELNRAIVRRVFHEEKYEVLAAENGVLAMEQLNARDVDIVLLDIQMPVMDGYEVIAAMKAEPRLAAIPIVVTTGAVDKSERRAFDMGADEFITQPYDPYILKKRVENLIDRYELREMRNVVKEQKRYRNLFNILGIAYWEWTRGSGYYHSEKYNDYAISDMEPEKIWDGETSFQYVHPDDVAAMKEFMSKHPDNEVKKSAIVRCLMKDGSYRWTEMFSVAETSPNGELTRLISMMRNVDKEWLEQKARLEDALQAAEEASRAKTAFLSRISHDMRTPLNGILGLTALLKDRVTDESIRNDLTELEMSGNYLLNLINDTLDMSRIESGKLELHPAVCDSRALFHNAIRLARTSMQGKNIRLSVDTGDLPSALLYVDVGRFDQIVLNVFGNAVKFTPDGGSIDFSLTTLSVEDGVMTARLTIRDTGIGMSSEFLPHIFDAFAQEDASRTSSYQGTGLGMAITKKLLQQMGGDVRVESALGKGSCFTLTLRFSIATDEQIAAWKAHRISADKSAQLHGRRILLCEDHPLNAKIATRLLEAKGMRVDHAENGQIGVELFARSVPGFYDAILMDIRMPVMDGLDAARAIRALPREDARRVPMIAMTANAFDDDVKQTREAGMNAHLSKPIQTDLLYAALNTLLQVDTDVRRQKILVVDDMETNRAVICASLAQDYDIVEAEDGVQALEILERDHSLDAVITDIQMPKMGGVELIHRIRSDERYRHVVIIANTQFGDPEQEERLLALGANDFVYKPTTPKIVEIRVRNALKKI